ncbi:LamG domain-containing protein [Streptomyces sp. NPDC050149]|uniref:LamG domain-containing protein n=1 Tax=Streptomyces sp. NPDC050149 TaxID=3365603 RepID=UPI00379DBD82
MVTGGLPALSAQAVAAQSAAAAGSGEDSAQARAVETGERVEVVDKRTERETVYANPDGSTFTLEKSIVPVRVPKAGGGWEAPDTTLVKRSDESIGPKAAVVDVSFSPGGDGSGLVTVGQDAQSVSLGWRGTLPAPQLEADRAVYADVLPGVNLILTATVEGFRQVLEVETPEAAANPALDSIEYDLEAENLTMRQGPGGGVDAVDGNGNTVFRSPAAQMWNSAGGSVAAAPAAGARLLTAPAGQGAATEGDPVQVGPLEEGDPLAGPGAGDESAVLDLAMGEKSMTVTPDASLLANTDAHEYPVYIDPPWEVDSSERTVLSSDGDSFYNFNGGDNGMSVGKCGSAVIGGVSYYCGNGYVNRMYFEFAPTGLAGKEILDASFNITETWSFSCDARWVDLERTNNISSATKWPGPAKLDQMGDKYVSAGRGSNCAPSQPRAMVKFNDNPDEPDENLTSTVRSFAAGDITRLTLMLMAKDETDSIAWKRFDDDAALSIDFVGKPAKPTGVGLVTRYMAPVGDIPPPSDAPCERNEAEAAVIGDPKATFTATPQTAAGGEKEAKLRIYFDVDQKSGTTWSDTPDVDGSLYPSTGYLGDGVPVTMTWSGLTDGTLYRMQAWTWVYSGTTHLLTSVSSGFCYFEVDSTAPAPPTIKANNAPYTLCQAQTCAPHGGPGIPGSFTFSPATGDENNFGYSYRLSTDPDDKWSSALAGETVTTKIAPHAAGTNKLLVKAKDQGGWGAPNQIQFAVSKAPDPIGQWHFQESANAALDTATAGTRHNATLAGAATRPTKGRRGEVNVNAPGTTPSFVPDRGLSVNGTTGYAATTGQVLDTRASYAVAAWVRLEDTSHFGTVVSQSGTNRSQFTMGYDSILKKWFFRAVDRDAPAGSTWTYQRASSKNDAMPGVWTHLTGVFDATAKTLQLYVNGALQETATYNTEWAATGPLQFGRAQWSGTYNDYFAGVIDEVAVWQDAHPADEILKDAELIATDSEKPSVERVADWNPADAAAGSAALADKSEYGHTMALSSGAAIAAGELVLNGTSGGGTTPGPVVDDSGSFTVTTRALVDRSKIASKPDGYRAQILGQRAGTGSSWSLWFKKSSKSQPVLDDDGQPVLDPDTGEPQHESVPSGTWHFGRLTADGSGADVASTAAVLDDDVQLTGVFNAQDRKIYLYVTSASQNTGTAYSAAVGSGNVEAGKGPWDNYLPGRLTDIRVWAGAMADTNQVKTVVFGEKPDEATAGT